MQPDTFELWKATDFFMSFDSKAMPRSLQLHLIDIDSALISHKLLADGQVLEQMVQLAHGKLSKEEEQQYSFLERMFKRLLIQTGFQVRQLCE